MEHVSKSQKISEIQQEISKRKERMRKYYSAIDNQGNIRAQAIFHNVMELGKFGDDKGGK